MRFKSPAQRKAVMAKYKIGDIVRFPRFKVNIRSWWKLNKDWPNGIEPDARARKTHYAWANDEEEAQQICKDYNSKHALGRLSRKAEYTILK